ncbi:MAG: hypothetical protein EP330_17405 [Deltaproteobacteria bacterium]|nr:MAG: hypothetical protein EP330_17405 [Deltaproteobacteria bacterium]
MRPLAAIALGCALAGPAFAAPSPEEVEARQEALEARAAELEARAAELEAMFEELEAQREAVTELREEAEALREKPEVVELHEVEGERIAIGDDTVVGADEVVDEVVSLGGDVHVYGRVRKDATSFGGRVHVHPGGRVDGNAIAIGGKVIVEDGAKVGGRVPLSTTGELYVEIDEDEPEPETPSRGAFASALYEIYSHLMFMLSFAGIGVLTVGLFPQRVGRIAKAIEERPVRVAVLGGFVNLMLFAATFFMAITIIGLPVAALLGVFLALSWLFGFVGLCQAIGDRLPMQTPGHGRWLAFLVGTVVVTFVGALGTLGVLTVLAASVVGMGAAFHTRLGGA